MTKGNKGRIGILTGGGDIPGLNPAIRGVTLRALQRGLRRPGHPPRLGRDSSSCKRDADADNSEWVVPLDEGTVDRYALRRRHLPALVAHAAQRRAGQGRAGAPASDKYTAEKNDLTDEVHRQPRVPRHRLPGADRRRRHAQLRRRARPPRLPRGRHPQDDGQRRARHGLLHGLRHLREPRPSRWPARSPARQPRTSASSCSRSSAATRASRRCCRRSPARPTAA